METLKLPVSDFQWVPKTKFKRWTAKDIINIPSQDDTGYAFEVDLHYPSYLHQVNPFFVLIRYLLFLTSNTMTLNSGFLNFLPTLLLENLSVSFEIT